MNREFFELYVKTLSAPTLQAGDVIILDNLSSHKSPKAKDAMRSVGAWFLFLPPYSPDLHPIEMAFSKLKALIRRAAALTDTQFYHKVSLKTGHSVVGSGIPIAPLRLAAENPEWTFDT